MNREMYPFRTAVNSPTGATWQPSSKCLWPQGGQSLDVRAPALFLFAPPEVKSVWFATPANSFRLLSIPAHLPKEKFQNLPDEGVLSTEGAQVRPGRWEGSLRDRMPRVL